jgi:glycosyltransferase involved in cell wall biosynthesis
MRVLLVGQGFAPTVGGAETTMWHLAAGLAGRGHQVHCLVGGDPFEPAPAASPAGVSRTPLLAHGARAAVDWLAAELAMTAARFGPDLVHMIDPHELGPAPALACFRALPGLAKVATVTGLSARAAPEVMEHSWQAALYASGRLRAALPTAAAVAAVLPPGIDLGANAPDGPRDPRLAILQPPVVFHPARLLPAKGGLTGLEAFALLRGSLGSGTLVLCASADTAADPATLGSYRHTLETGAARLGVAAALVFVELAADQMPAAYRAADLVWVPTIGGQPFGLAALEAMACAVPVVAASSGALRETVEPGRSGLLVPPADPVALAGAAAAVLSDGRLRADLVAGGLARAAGFDRRGHARDVERAYALAMAAASVA